MSAELNFPDRNLALELVRVTETAALAASTWVGRGDKDAADGAAVAAMRKMINTVDMSGVIVIGEGEKDNAPMLHNGEAVGNGSGNSIRNGGGTWTVKKQMNCLLLIWTVNHRRKKASKSRNTYLFARSAVRMSMNWLLQEPNYDRHLMSQRRVQSVRKKPGEE